MENIIKGRAENSHKSYIEENVQNQSPQEGDDTALCYESGQIKMNQLKNEQLNVKVKRNK